MCGRYVSPMMPNSAAHPEPLKRRSLWHPSSRRPGGRRLIKCVEKKRGDPPAPPYFTAGGTTNFTARRFRPPVGQTPDRVRPERCKMGSDPLYKNGELDGIYNTDK